MDPFDLPSTDEDCQPPCPPEARCVRCFTDAVWADELCRRAHLFRRSGSFEDHEAVTDWLASPPWLTNPKGAT